MIGEYAAQAPKGMKVRLLFEDEGRFGRISDRRRCWAPLPLRLIVGHQVIRQYMCAVVAHCPFDGRIAGLILSWSDTVTISIFLAHTARQFADGFCIIITDGAGWHRANELRIPDHIRLLFLPPHSPEQNPVEHVWEHLREYHFRNAAFPAPDSVEAALMSGIRSLIGNPELVKSFALFNWIKTPLLT
ncbi:MAG: transposase [Kiritimatiellaeota bacterium]|nr:transposase [Kiritimatiellota bacterium]